MLTDRLPVVLMNAEAAWQAGRVQEREQGHDQQGVRLTVAWMMG